jgi:hypothetical protein
MILMYIHSVFFFDASNKGVLMYKPHYLQPITDDVAGNIMQASNNNHDDEAIIGFSGIVKIDDWKGVY